MGTTSSKPKATAWTTSKPKHGSAAVPNGFYDRRQYHSPVYRPPGAEAAYGYPYPGVIPNYAPVIPPSVMQQYPPYYPAYIPPPITMPQPQHYVPPQPVARPAIPVTAQAAAQPQPTTHKPVIPTASPPERVKKRKATRKKMPTAVITFELPNGEHATRPSQMEADPTHPPDLSRSLSSATPSHQARSPTRSQHKQTPASSPTRSYHERRASTHTSSQADRPLHPVVLPPADERSGNPLPRLPVDVFATTPYKHVLEPRELPAWPPLEPGRTFMVQQEVQQAPPPKKGLFGLRKKNPPPPLSQTKFVYLPHPVSATASNPPTTATTSEPPPTSAGSINPPMSATTVDTPYTDFEPDPRNRGFEPSLPPIYFNQDTEYAPFLNHSPHSVSYERVRYPTATHLIEAMKFLPETDHNRGISELIRKCMDLADVYRLSQEHMEAQNAENRESYMAKMERVMYLKFNQHGDLADLLLSTGEASLIYDDPSDSFWGIGDANGEPGHNELGRMLEVIRARLRQERKK